MNTDLTKEQLDALKVRWALNEESSEDNLLIDNVFSMARRTLQAEERLGRAVQALRNLYDEQNGPPLERHKERWKMAMDQALVILKECEDSPKDLPPPLPCAPPAHSDAQP